MENIQEIKAKLVDMMNAFDEAKEPVNSKFLLLVIDLIEELEDKVNELESVNEELHSDLENLLDEDDYEEPCDPLTEYEVWGE